MQILVMGSGKDEKEGELTGYVKMDDSDLESLAAAGNQVAIDELKYRQRFDPHNSGG